MRSRGAAPAGRSPAARGAGTSPHEFESRLRRAAPVVGGHRGSPATSPENTLSSFRRAVADGAGLIEFDVRLTADFAFVVVHDRTYRRTAGTGAPVRSLTAAEAQTLDAGSWYASEFRNESVPLLAEALNALPSEILVNIEVKTDGERRRDARWADRLADFLRARSECARILISSFDHRILSRLHSIAPDFYLGALALPVRDATRSPLSIRRRTGAGALICSASQLRDRTGEAVLDAGMVLICYGINSERALHKALRAGAQGLITDSPGWLVRLLRP